MKNVLFLFLAMMILASCGPRIINLQSPADGQTYVLGQFQVIDVQIADFNQYQGTTIEFRSNVPQEFMTCQNGAGGPARCTSFVTGNYFPQGQNISFNTCKSPACSVTIVLKKDGQLMDVRTIFVQRQDGNVPQ